MKDPLLINHDYSDSPFGAIGSRCPTRSTISTSESGQELWPVGVKLGIVRLGHAAGKLKYTLVDEQDIVLAKEYTFEARLEMDTQFKTGAVVFAYAYLTSQNRNAALLLQDLIWRRHNGPIPPRSRVVHRNHISMDNRLDNLCLIDIDNAHVWYTRVNVAKPPSGELNKAAANDLHLTLYWAAIQQLPPEQQPNQHNQAPPASMPPTAAAASTPATAPSVGLGAATASTSSASSSSSSSASSSGSVATQNAAQYPLAQSSPSSQFSRANLAANASLNDNSSSPSSPLALPSSMSTSPSPSSSHASPTAPTAHQNHHIYSHSHHHHHHHSFGGSGSSRNSANTTPKCYDPEGNLLDSEEGHVYYECHYPPCVRIEREPREFSICGRCQETRYCGTVCQQLDWPHHKRHCRNKSSRRAAPYWTGRWDPNHGGNANNGGEQR